MTAYEFLPASVDIGMTRRLNRLGCRTVLVIVDTIASCHRLMDVVAYVEDDPRVQVVFTAAPGARDALVAQWLRGLDGLVLRWHEVATERFDLAVGGSWRGLREIPAPLLWLGNGTWHGMDLQRVDAAIVAGDPCLDRLVASVPRREDYRRALGVRPGQDLLVVSSGWGRDGLAGRRTDLFGRLTEQLSRHDARVAALLHPAVWSAHGRRQVRAWLRECREAGLILLDPVDDWRGLVVAADYVVGDQGPVLAYAAALGLPTLRLRRRGSARGSGQELSDAATPTLELDQPLLAQLHRSRAASGRDHGRGPVPAEGHLRQAMYRLLRLPQPATHRPLRPVPGVGERSS